MDPYSLLDKNGSEASAPNEELNSAHPQGSTAAANTEDQADKLRFPAEDGGQSLAEMAQRDLAATLQLLVERAQYITGASGAAIALRNGKDMVCRASAGNSAPEVGAELRVNSGLSGESVRTKQTLRCDDALTDTRVNRESCEALGIRSVVVMPLLQGELVIGVFELFSDKANVFEARDITALERMGSMVHTALEESGAGLEGAGSAVEDLPAGDADAADEEAVTQEEYGDALGATPAKAVTREPAGEAVSTAGAAEYAVDSSGAAEASQRGRIEDLGATLSTGSGIAFHRRVPAKQDTRAKGEMWHTESTAGGEIHPDATTTIEPSAESFAQAQTAGLAADHGFASRERDVEKPAGEGARRSTDSSEHSAENLHSAEGLHSSENLHPVEAVRSEEEEVDVLELPDGALAQAGSDRPPDDVLSDLSSDEAVQTASDGVQVTSDAVQKPSEVRQPTSEAVQMTTDAVQMASDAVQTAEVGRPTSDRAADELRPDNLGPKELATSGLRSPVANLRKCEACGFPVSEGRKLCLDCEKKTQPSRSAGGSAKTANKAVESSPPDTREPVGPETVIAEHAGNETPLFLGSAEEEASWLASHKLMVVAVVLAILVIVVLMMMR